MPAIASPEDLRAAQKEGRGICVLPHVSSRAETNASGDALCSMRPVGVGWMSEPQSN